MKTYLLLLLVTGTLMTKAQNVGIGTTDPNPNAALDITATGKGLLIPRMDSATRVAIVSPPDGLMVFQTDQRKGFWYAINSAWLYIPDKATAGDNLGNHQASANIALNNHNLLLRTATDNNHALGWYGTNKLWNNTNIDGPVLSGFMGGVLGTSAGSLKSILTWHSNSRVGINNSLPQQTLDVGGTVRAEQFTYASPKTRQLVIPIDAFRSISPANYNVSFTNASVNNDVNLSYNLHLTGGVAGQPGYVMAPVYLPEGVTITNLELIAWDYDGTSVTPQVSISNVTPNIGANTLNSSLAVKVALNSESTNFQTVTTSLNHVVTNTYSYKVIVRLNQNSSATNLGLVRITYTEANP